MDNEKFEKSKPPLYDGGVNVHSGFDKITGQKVDLSQAERDQLYIEATADDKAAAAREARKLAAQLELDDANARLAKAVELAKATGLISVAEIIEPIPEPPVELEDLDETVFRPVEETEGE